MAAESKAKPTVFEAWAAVMADVQAVRKGDRNTQQGYMFRGIDAVMNATGPAFRKHGVAVVPTLVGIVADERYKTSKGTEMRGVTINVTWRVTGPAGDSFEGQSLGESADSGDKAIPKAHSVAYRTFLLQALCLPTDEPDPDQESHERAAKPRQAAGNGNGQGGAAATEEQRTQLADLVGDLMVAGKITPAQVLSAAGLDPDTGNGSLDAQVFAGLSEAKAAELVARLSRYAERTAAA